MCDPDNRRGTAPRVMLGFLPTVAVLLVALILADRGHPVAGVVLAIVLVPVGVWLNYRFIRPLD